MHNHTTKPPFGEKSPKGQPAPQAAPSPGTRQTSHGLAERHEALWVRLAALHQDVRTLSARRPAAAVSPALRATAESLLADCAPFAPGRRQRLPVAAPDHGGLLVQLGQALATLDAFEAAHSQWRPELNAFVWRVKGDVALPVGRLRPRLSAAAAPATDPGYAAYQAGMTELREKLAIRIAQFRQR